MFNESHYLSIALNLKSHDTKEEGLQLGNVSLSKEKNYRKKSFEKKQYLFRRKRYLPGLQNSIQVFCRKTFRLLNECQIN